MANLMDIHDLEKLAVGCNPATSSCWSPRSQWLLATNSFLVLSAVSIIRRNLARPAWSCRRSETFYPEPRASCTPRTWRCPELSRRSGSRSCPRATGAGGTWGTGSCAWGCRKRTWLRATAWIVITRQRLPRSRRSYRRVLNTAFDHYGSFLWSRETAARLSRAPNPYLTGLRVLPHPR